MAISLLFTLVVLQEVRDLLVQVADAKGIVVSFNVAQHTVQSFIADNARLTQVKRT